MDGSQEGENSRGTVDVNMDEDHDDQGGTAAAQDMPEDGDFIAEEDVVAEFEVGDEQDRMAEDAVEDDAVEDEDGGDGEDRVAVEDMAMATFKGHSDAVYCVAANPKNPSQVATGGGDDKGFLWEVGKDGAIAASRELTGHSDSVASVGFSADGSLVATGCYGGIVKVWECSTGSLKHTLEGPEDIEWLTWHSLGSVLLAGSQDGTVWMWDAVAGTCMQVFAGHEKKVSCGTFTSSGKAVVTGSDDGTVRVWAPRTGECRHSFGGHGFHEGAVTCLARHPDPAQSPLIATGGEDGTARVVHIQTKRVLGTLVHCQAEEGSVEAVGFCASHPWVGTAATDGNLKVWDSVTGSCRHTCSHPGPVTNLEWHPSQPFVFTSCVDGGVRAWDARVGTCDKVWTGHTDMILDLRLMDPLPWIQDGGIVQGMGASNSSAAGESDQAVAILTASDDHTSKVFFWTLPAQQGQSSSSAPGEGAIARLEGP